MIANKVEQIENELNMATENSCLSTSKVLTISQQLDDIINELMELQVQAKSL